MCDKMAMNDLVYRRIKSTYELIVTDSEGQVVALEGGDNVLDIALEKANFKVRDESMFDGWRMLYKDKLEFVTAAPQCNEDSPRLG